ncbi:aminoacyl-tRNA deacylase [Paenalcaligenes niemegkensis]|uniref:aminoacyl-tRNA deacylase n=1 Tax=Paenalcaligenes niemegkensis TaxID=2895469 RepID=UPI001EE821DD|nr:aminoacyl-tRNA deacylase [Paenalcaligenes niemegkensis]MCQ9615826.1 aminoacyl-tRNA deacylase [Paenalcaligenes niemegkensis]
MTKAKHVSETPATLWLRRNNIVFTEHTYAYIDHGGALEAARQLQLPPHAVAKTLIMEDENTKPLIIIMRGDCEVSTKNLARQIGVKKITPCKPDVAQRHTAYQVGGTSPFGTRKPLPVYIEAELLNEAVIYINGGRRGYLIAVSPTAAAEALNAIAVNVGIAA